MKKIGISLAVLSMFAFTACKDKTKDVDKEDEMMEETNMDMEDSMNEEEDIKVITIALEARSDSKANGKVTFEEKDGMVSMTANIEGLQPGTHAIHIHEKADCSAADGTSAGGHWNPTFEDHGKWGDAKGYHKGDIGNFEADDTGNGEISMQTDEWCLGCGDSKKDLMGKSVIVHQGADDFTSQPSGAAGARVSCGGIIQ
ncbi:superoxide dismutase family protein [Constantimarinum furrinae]|uniref:Superoxide dismutase n=1 Tax=Constantimarinum furrinae TaxID=2562285 RepID=A0A7G8PVV2_9FLAO|nr:superoxide dismutase family protein [Constantimarinum furrinae]QNJ98468.1 Superoxide dismutase [Constantimarinum furrinae]